MWTQKSSWPCELFSNLLVPAKGHVDTTSALWQEGWENNSQLKEKTGLNQRDNSRKWKRKGTFAIWRVWEGFPPSSFLRMVGIYNSARRLMFLNYHQSITLLAKKMVAKKKERTLCSRRYHRKTPLGHRLKAVITIMAFYSQHFGTREKVSPLASWGWNTGFVICWQKGKKMLGRNCQPKISEFGRNGW